jgi:hypothetical protein
MVGRISLGLHPTPVFIYLLLLFFYLVDDNGKANFHLLGKTRQNTKWGKAEKYNTFPSP